MSGGALSAQMRDILAGGGKVNKRRPSPGRGKGQEQPPDKARDASGDKTLQEKQAELAALKRKRSEALESAKGLIAKLQPGGGRPVEQRALQYRYDVHNDVWTEHRCLVRTQAKPLAEGGMRWCIRMMLDTRPDAGRNGTQEEAVAKIFKPEVFRNRRSEVRSYAAEAMTQMHARHLAELFNTEMSRRGLQKQLRPIRMLPASVATLPETGKQLINIEPILEGKFVKHNDNDGNISTKDDLPQAFSHFSFHVSGGSVLVCDIQGVGNNFTDPQIHSIDGKGYGIGNIGPEGMRAFIKSHKCNRVCRALGLSPPAMPQNLSSGSGVWNSERFEGAMKKFMAKTGFLENAPQNAKEDEAEKARLLKLIAQKKEQLAQQKAMLQASPRSPSTGTLSPFSAQSTPTEAEAIEAKKALLLGQIEKKKRELAEKQASATSSPAVQPDVADPQQILAKQKLVLDQRSERRGEHVDRSGGESQKEANSPLNSTGPRSASPFATLSVTEREAMKVKLQAQLLAMQNKTPNPNGPTNGLLSATPTGSAADSEVGLKFDRSGMSAAAALPDPSSNFNNDLLHDGASPDRLGVTGQSPAPIAANGGHTPAMALPNVGSAGLFTNETKGTAFSVSSPMRLRMKMPEDRLLLAFRHANWFACFLLLWAFLAFFLGIFVPFGFPSWGISVPTTIVIVAFFRFCTPMSPPEDGVTMPLPLRLSKLLAVFVALTSFIAGILAASGAVSIRSLVFTPVCMEPDLWAQMQSVEGIVSVNTTNFYDGVSVNPVPAVLAENPLAAMPYGLSPLPLQVSLIDVQEIDSRLDRCRGWNMCIDYTTDIPALLSDGKTPTTVDARTTGVKMGLSCAQMISVNEWNAVFFFFSSFLLPPLYYWVYSILSVRLQEHNIASQTGFTQVQDMSCMASFRRSIGCCWDGVCGSAVVGGISAVASGRTAVPMSPSDARDTARSPSKRFEGIARESPWTPGSGIASHGRSSAYPV